MNEQPLVRLIDDDEIFLMSQKLLLETRGFSVETYSSAKAFLENDQLSRPGCAVADIRMPGLTGLEMQTILESRRSTLPLIFLTGHGDVSMAVHTMRHGAADFLEKPVKPDVLIAVVTKAVEASVKAWQAGREKAHVEALYAELTPRGFCRKTGLSRAAADFINGGSGVRGLPRSGSGCRRGVGRHCRGERFGGTFGGGFCVGIGG